MARYVNPECQLVVELYTRDLKASMKFYIDLGFEVVRDEGDFAALKWEASQLFIEEVADAPSPTAHPVGNIRIMVPNVDHYWELSQKMGARVTRPIADRYYGLRDFTIAGPDGLAIRFATRLPDSH